MSFDIPSNPINHAAHQRERRDAGEDRSKVRRLRISIDAAVFLHIGCPIGSGDVIVLLLILLGIVRTMDCLGHFYHLTRNESPIDDTDREHAKLWGDHVVRLD